MKPSLKRNLLRVATATAMVCAATIVLFPAAVAASPAEAAAYIHDFISSIRIR